MEVGLVPSGIQEEETAEAYDINYEISDEVERCGICMDVIVDRGVLDCCQHWFCFVCIDNWATITNLCPLCQKEFQLITCVPVYDTIGSNKVDEESFSRNDDWCFEGKSNISFPSYYIDENLSAWMVTAVRLEMDLYLLKENLILIPQLLVTLVIHGIMHSVLILILMIHLKVHGYAQDVGLMIKKVPSMILFQSLTATLIQ